MTQLTMDAIAVDSVTGQELKREGLATVEANNQAFIDTLRIYAKQHSKEYGEVSSDDLRLYATGLGLYPHHQNAWGGILRGKGWRIIGRKMSTLPSNHAREIRIYRWEGA